MSQTYVPAELRRLVSQRAGNRFSGPRASICKECSTPDGIIKGNAACRIDRSGNDLPVLNT